MNQESGICDIKELLKRTDKEKIWALDVEGAPIKITQLSLIGTHNNASKQIYNAYCESGLLTKGKKKVFLSIMKRAKVLVGYNIDSDIKALSLQGISIPDHVVSIDLYYTFRYLMEQKGLSYEELSGCALQDVARYYGINQKQGFHNSLVDAKVTMELFWRMAKKTQGEMWVVKFHETNIAPNLKELYGNEVKKHMEAVDIPDMIDYSYEEPDILMKTEDGFYQGMVVMGKKERLVRLSKKEYKLLKKIRKLVPNYPLNIFYSTIVIPGTQEAIRCFEESRMKTEKESPESDAIDQVDIEEMPNSL